MSQIKFTVKLFNTIDYAADGSQIPRRSCEEYLTSVNYEKSIRNKTAIGGLTHKDRRLRPEFKGIVGNDDQVFINDNATHYITRLYFKDQADNFFYSDAETFDPELFAGKRAENIQNVVGMLASGVRMPVSCVIQALWSKRNVAEKIIMMKGFDFTQNNSFKGAELVGDIKIFSETIEDNDKLITEDEIRQFSNANPDIGECKLQTRIYSSSGEVQIIDDGLSIGKKIYLFDKIFSDPSKQSTTLDEVVSTYGIFSEQVKVAKELAKDSDLTKEVLSSVTLDKKDQDKERLVDPDDDVNLSYWANKFADYTNEGDRDKLQTLFRGNRDNIRQIVHSVPKDDPKHDEYILTRLNQFFRVNPQTASFSTISSIADRVRNQTQPRYNKINRIIKAYQAYWQSKGNKMSKKDKDNQKLLFIQDLNLLIKEVLPEVYDGKSFNSLYGLNRYGDEVRKTALRLSVTYRKLLISNKIMRFIPKQVYTDWKSDILNFYEAMSKYVFDGDGLVGVNIDLTDLGV